MCGKELTLSVLNMQHAAVINTHSMHTTLVYINDMHEMVNW